MILGATYAYKGIRKSYKKHKAKKQEEQEATKGTLPDIQDPSSELDSACLAERSTSRSTQKSTSSRSSSGSESTKVAQKALENDPEFQAYMERQRNLYLANSRGLPPTYESSVHHTMPAPAHTPIHQVSSPVQSMSAMSPGSESEHCPCHNCMAVRQNWTPHSAPTQCKRNIIQELPAPMSAPVELDVPSIQINNGSQTFKSRSSAHEDDGLVLCEMPGDMPAILPERKSVTPVELPTA